MLGHHRGKTMVISGYVDLREQKIGIEVEMTGITRRRAAEVIAEYLGSTVNHEEGYGTYSVKIIG